MEELSFKVAVFEGPLDLLLHLIAKNKVSIYDIPIAEITDQYFEYMAAAQETDMELGGEFLVMAAQLLLIKSRMLLPVEEDDDEEDPRMDLARRLEEYRRYKLVSEEMDKLQHFADSLCFKDAEPLSFPKIKIENKPLNVESLYAAFLTVLERGENRKRLNPHSFRGVIGRTNYSVRTASAQIMSRLGDDEVVEFEELFDGMCARGELVAAFLAVLELIKENFVSVVETDGKIYCMRGEKDGELKLGEEY